MRVATLLLCLTLAACAGTPAPEAAAPAAAAVGPPPARSGEPDENRPDAVTQARVDCWMKVEGQKSLHGIDQRIAFVDKCVSQQLKSKPNP